jgi:hypothetical protein
VDKDGLEGEPIELSGGMKNFSFGESLENSWEDDRGLDGGLPGEQAEAEGSTRLMGEGKEEDSWGLWLGRTFEMAWEIDEDAWDRLWALMTGLTIEQARDLRIWLGEVRWLERVLGNDWILS